MNKSTDNEFEIIDNQLKKVKKEISVSDFYSLCAEVTNEYLAELRDAGEPEHIAEATRTIILSQTKLAIKIFGREALENVDMSGCVGLISKAMILSEQICGEEKNLIIN